MEITGSSHGSRCDAWLDGGNGRCRATRALEPHLPGRTQFLGQRVYPRGAAATSPATGSGRAVPVGNGPQISALDPATHTLYAANGGAGTVSVIDAATCNAHVASGCHRTFPTVTVGGSPVGIAVDDATDTIYVTNANGDNVSVINGATCNARHTSGCDQTAGTSGMPVSRRSHST